MTGIVIGAGIESIYAIKTAKTMGHTVAAIDGSEDAEGLKYADYSIITDIKEPNNVIMSLGDIKPDFILPVPIGRYLTTTGFISDYYGLKALTHESSILCTDKLLFHERMQKYGLRSVQCHCIAAGQSAIGDINFPVIVKPRYGSGSRKVSLINDYSIFKKEIIDTLPFNEDFIVEDVMGGDEYGIDAAVINGKFILILLRKKVITPPPACQCIAYANIVKNDANKRLFSNIENYMDRSVKVLGLNHCLLHADLMVNDSLDVSAVEISGRPSGHRLHDIFTPMAGKVDMIGEYINYACGNPYDFEAKPDKNLAIRYFDFENCNVIKQPDLSELKKSYDIIEYQCNIGDEYLGSVNDGHSIMNRGYFILSGENPEDALQKCQDIINLFHVRF